jgi:hypothetical protein
MGRGGMLFIVTFRRICCFHLQGSRVIIPNTRNHSTVRTWNLRSLWDNVKTYSTAHRPQMTVLIRHMRFVCWITKATDTHLEYSYVILIAFPRQQWLRERASMSRLYVRCLLLLFELPVCVVDKPYCVRRWCQLCSICQPLVVSAMWRVICVQNNVHEVSA